MPIRVLVITQLLFYLILPTTCGQVLVTPFYLKTSNTESGKQPD